jgi:hypothetical protein
MRYCLELLTVETNGSFINRFKLQHTNSGNGFAFANRTQRRAS